MIHQFFNSVENEELGILIFWLIGWLLIWICYSGYKISHYPALYKYYIWKGFIYGMASWVLILAVMAFSVAGMLIYLETTIETKLLKTK